MCTPSPVYPRWASTSSRNNVDMNWGKLALASGLLLGAQVLHTVEVIAFGPVSIKGEGGIGEPLGLLGLIGAGVAMIAALNRRNYAIPLAIASGVSVAAGFLL